jgi:NADH-quinone oxidoreductase subunit G
MSDSQTTDTITIEVNGKPVEARVGSMLIQATDEAGIHIPRFCYHKKLSIAANCRMCLVEVEKAPKPMPACATPVNEGMKVWTHSVKAVSAQKDNMEFLLINHPLDCPICDQGGECELQDLSVAYGNSSSNYIEAKRVVRDKYIGPLIATEMTRCIQCTRCVRFGEEISGMREMGATGRGDRMEIGTFVEKSITSELSGNIIDICPVGALTARPSRYKARAWEVMQHPSIASHDSVGSNIYLHSFNKQVIRTVPRENEAINECWISDRDRFSYQALSAEDRLLTPMIKENGQWKSIDWNQALDAVVECLNNADPETTGVLASPRATLEELYSLQKLMRAKGVNNIDHRLRQTDFSDQQSAPQFPWLGMQLEDLEKQKAVLLIGSDVRREQPMANHRIRKAVLKGASVSVVNPIAFAFNYDIAEQCVTDPAGMIEALGKIANASGAVPASLSEFVADADEAAQNIAQSLKDADTDSSIVLLGNIATQHPSYGILRALASVIAENTGANLGYLAESANTAGAWLAGVVPHRLAGGASTEGRHTHDMLMSATKTFILFDVEPAHDFNDPQLAEAAMSHAECVVAFTSFASDKLRSYANILLPISTFAETSGTFVNTEGKMQSFKGAGTLQGDSRPGWKILRVLGNMMDIDGFDYMSTQDILTEFKELVSISSDNALSVTDDYALADVPAGLQRIGNTHMYATDSLVRRAEALQKSAAEDCNSVALHPADIASLGLTEGETVTVRQGDGSTVLMLVKSLDVPQGCAHIPSGTSKSSALGAAFGVVEIQGAMNG